MFQDLFFMALPGRNFEIMPTPVTQSDWFIVMGKNPSYFKRDLRLPVDQVSWNDVQEFIKKINESSEWIYRLPTEEEWEYCCRAGNYKTYGPYPAWEWCQDLQEKAGSGCVLCGGGWGYFTEYLRSAVRGNGVPGYRSNGIGFRLVRTRR